MPAAFVDRTVGRKVYQDNAFDHLLDLSKDVLLSWDRNLKFSHWSWPQAHVTKQRHCSWMYAVIDDCIDTVHSRRHWPWCLTELSGPTASTQTYCTPGPLNEITEPDSSLDSFHWTPSLPWKTPAARGLQVTT